MGELKVTNEREYLIRRAECLSKAFLQSEEYNCLPDNKRQDLAVFAVFVKNYLEKNGSELDEFAEYLEEYARACQASGYDGIGKNDIIDKLKEFKNEN